MVTKYQDNENDDDLMITAFKALKMGSDKVSFHNPITLL
jgi:hypothetical protein